MEKDDLRDLAIGGSGLVILIAFIAKVYNNPPLKVRQTIAGKSLAVIGMQNSGKSSILKFLADGSLPSSWQSPEKPLAYRGRTAKIHKHDEHIAVKLSELKDLGSAPFDVDRKALVIDADVVFYVFRADKVHANDQGARQRILNDLELVRRWIDERAGANENKRPKLLLVGTFADKIDNQHELYTRTIQHPTIAAAHQKCFFDGLAVGSADTSHNAAHLLYDTLKQI